MLDAPLLCYLYQMSDHIKTKRGYIITCGNLQKCQILKEGLWSAAVQPLRMWFGHTWTSSIFNIFYHGISWTMMIIAVFIAMLFRFCRVLWAAIHLRPYWSIVMMAVSFSPSVILVYCSCDNDCIAALLIYLVSVTGFTEPWFMTSRPHSSGIVHIIINKWINISAFNRFHLKVLYT